METVSKTVWNRPVDGILYGRWDIQYFIYGTRFPCKFSTSPARWAIIARKSCGRSPGLPSVSVLSRLHNSHAFLSTFDTPHTSRSLSISPPHSRTHRTNEACASHRKTRSRRQLRVSARCKRLASQQREPNKEYITATTSRAIFLDCLPFSLCRLLQPQRRT